MSIMEKWRLYIQRREIADQYRALGKDREEDHRVRVATPIIRADYSFRGGTVYLPGNSIWKLRE